MANALLSVKSTTISALAPLLLAAVMLLAPARCGLRLGVRRPRRREPRSPATFLLEKLIPNSYHHPGGDPTRPRRNSTSGGIGLDSSVVLHGVSAFALPAVMAPAFLPELVSYLEGATAALLTAAAAALLLTQYALPYFINSPRPQTDVAPPEKTSHPRSCVPTFFLLSLNSEGCALRREATWGV